MTLEGILRELRAPPSVGLSPWDRTLDAAIAELLGHEVGWDSTRHTIDLFATVRWRAPHPHAGEKERCPMFTATIDEALDLFAGTLGAEAAIRSLAACSARFLSEDVRDLSRLPRALLADLVETLGDSRSA